MVANTSNPTGVRYGLRERLLLSFIAISGFSVVAAVVGIYAFYAIGEALHRVTDRSVPPAIATLELAQRTERIVAAGPALLAAANNSEFSSASAAVEEAQRRMHDVQVPVPLEQAAGVVHQRQPQDQRQPFPREGP